MTKANELEDFDYDNIVFDHLDGIINEFNPDLIGLTCMFTMTHKSLKNVIDHIANRYKIPIAVGGVHITNSIQSDLTREKFIEDLSNANFFFFCLSQKLHLQIL